MESSTKKNKRTRTIHQILLRIGVCLVVLFVGMAGMVSLSSMKKPPVEVVQTERPLRVEAVKIVPEDVQVSISGFGEVRSLNEVSIAPEVSGNVIYVHHDLELGEIIPDGEILFRIEASDYEAALMESKATVAQWQNTIARLEKQYAIDRVRLNTLRRNRSLAQAEFDRVRRLYEKDSVGTRSGVEAAERAYNNAVDVYDQLMEAVSLYPIRIREAENSQTSAQAKFAIAQKNLERCSVRSPFNARIKEVTLEAGQYVAPGQTVLMLADDSVLEIQVPLDSRDARQWLQFETQNAAYRNPTWFKPLVPVVCRIRWTEDDGDHYWEGTLHRVVKFDQQTRTLTVAVRIDASKIFSKDIDALPLVDGMFCAVDIPARTLQQVFRVPRWAVSFDQTVYAVSNNRLKTVPVQVAYSSGEDAYIAEGLAQGDVVIVTRLIDPLENTLVELTIKNGEV